MVINTVIYEILKDDNAYKMIKWLLLKNPKPQIAA